MVKTLEQIRAQLGDCRRCELCETRTTIVFGVGNPHAQVMLIGEAPGRQEDLGAEPFIGAAGKLLNSMLDLAGLSRPDVYIANILKCRPPHNADPLPHQIEACTPFLREQVRSISPLILVALGRFASQFILKTDTGISHLRGKIQIAGRFSVLPIFHPAAAIYDKTKLKLLENDFRLLGRLVTQRRQELAKRAQHQAGQTQEVPATQRGASQQQLEQDAPRQQPNQTEPGQPATDQAKQ
ncbi:MAG: uracil-DNA glycosylase [Coriobacteriales bacterium]|jgi:DNA polymerase|nr:uracil-DNA glycosylase [Coriobacteriales bacterium]